ncbi:MAG: DUF6263 family protein [Chlorobium sp.]|nr:DUF6263 family protein [Chlorobium sp.]
MKYLITLFLLSTILFFSCQQKKTEEGQKTTEEVTSTFDSSALPTTNIGIDSTKSFFLKYNFKPGESFKYRMTVISKNEQSIQTDTVMAAKLDQRLIYIMNFKTESLDKDSIAELVCTFTSINLKANVNGQEITYQSDSGIDSTEKTKFAEYEAFLNNPFNIRVGKQGELIEIYKTDKIMNRFLSIRGLEDSLNAQDKVLFKEDMSNRSIKPLLVQIFREVPEHQLAKDSTWSYKRESMPVLVFKIDYTNVYKIDKLEMLGDEMIAVVDGMVKTNITGDQTYSERGVNYKFDKPVTSASGKIYINLDKGLIQKSRTETRMETTYKMEMPTPQGTKKGSAREFSSTTNVLELL